MKRLLPIMVLVLGTLRLCAQQPSAFPVATPESQGVSSQAIIDFLEAIPPSGNEFHSFMLLRHGHLIAQGWWNPYAPELKHTLYSLSKSFTATAIGFAVSEKRLTVNDKVLSFFSKSEWPDTVSPYLSALRVRDLLTMSVGMDPEPSNVVRSNVDWVKAFLATPIVHEPGTKFLYNSTATFMLSAIVQQVTGQKVIDYLRPRLFDPLGITGEDWETSPLGINTGGWGLRLKTEDIAKFAELFLEKGMYKGKQIVPRAWVEDASTKKIEQEPDAPQSKKDSSDWLQGYCYQMWRCRNNCYRGDGAFGQYAIVMPDQDAVIAITSESQTSMQSELNLIWKYLLRAFQSAPLPENSKAATELKRKLAGLSLPPAPGTGVALQDSVSGRTYQMGPSANPQQVGFRFRDGNCTLTLKTDTASYTVVFGSGKWVKGSTNMPGPYLVTAKGNRAGLGPYLVDGSYTWTDDKTLELTLRYIESPHTEKMRCMFVGNRIWVQITRSFDKDKKLFEGVSN